MRELRIHHIDAFTSHMFGGNPAVIVFNGDGFEEGEMRNIALEMGEVVTAFVFSSDKADFQIRTFTHSGKELPYCGHSFVSALYAIERDRRFGVQDRQSYRFNVETGVGVVQMEIDLSRPEGNLFKFLAPRSDLEPVSLSAAEAAKALGIDPAHIDNNLPLLHSKMHGHLVMAAPSLDALGALTVDFEQMSSHSGELDTLLCAVVTPHAFNRQNHAHVRAFAPSVGIHEDPFTGSLQGSVVSYLLDNDLLSADQTVVRTEQGHFLGRPGHCENEILNRDPLQVQLHAEAVHVFATDIQMV